MAIQLNFKTVQKDKLFYDNYRYCMSFHLDEISALKTLDHDYIDMIIARRKVWRDMSRQRWGSVKSSIPTIMSASHATIISKRWRDITQKTEEDLHKLANLLIHTSIDFKFVTSVDNGWVYTNSKILIKRLTEMKELTQVEYKEVHINRPKNTVKLKNPKYTHRSYFKIAKLTEAEKIHLVNFFINQSSSIRLSPSLAQWTVEPFKRTQDYYFIDYTGEQWLIMLALIKPGLVRKTSTIISA